MVFLTIWLFGDLTNLLGALFTNLAPTAIALASYFCCSDIILISQCLYYNTINARRAAAEQNQEPTDVSEESPLISGSASQARKASEGENEAVGGNTWVFNAMCLLGVYTVGFTGWFISYKAGAWDGAQPSHSDDVQATKETKEIIGLVLGYMSAACYLCARIPQIIKNYRQKSCEGLALLFFMLSLTGNLMYGSSLFSYSQDKAYLLNALPWFMGSLGTIVEDCIIFVQFRLYSKNTRRSTIES